MKLFAADALKETPMGSWKARKGNNVFKRHGWNEFRIMNEVRKTFHCPIGWTLAAPTLAHRDFMLHTCTPTASFIQVLTSPAMPWK